MNALDVLIPTYRRPAALAVTLTSLLSQTFRDFRVVIADQTEDDSVLSTGEIEGVRRLLALRGIETLMLRNLPRRGMAHQRSFLLAQAVAPLVLYLDDDLVLEPGVIERLIRVLGREGCGFAGAAPIGLSYQDDIRPGEQAIEPWQGRVEPEVVLPGSPAWQRYKLHNAANVLHVQDRLGLGDEGLLLYKVAWVGGCVLYDTGKLRDAGGFDFWPDLPSAHCGEDVLAQLLVMAAYGGCGVLPSGVYHLELPTQVQDRRVNAPEALVGRLLPPLLERRVRSRAGHSAAPLQ